MIDEKLLPYYLRKYGATNVLLSICSDKNPESIRALAKELRDKLNLGT